MGKSVIIYEAEMGSSEHIDNKNKDTLILGEGPAHGLDYTTLTAAAKYSVSFIQPKIKFVLSLHYTTVSYWLILQQYINSKQTALKLKIIHCV